MIDFPVEEIIPDAYNLLKKEQISKVVDHGFVEYFYSRNDLRTGILDFRAEGNLLNCILPCMTYVKVNVEITGEAVREVTGEGGTKREQRVKIGEGGNNPAKIGCINNFFDSLFEGVEVSVLDQYITKADKHNPFVGYIQKLVNSAEAPRDMMLPLQGWARDMPGFMDSVDSSQNWGLLKRGSFFYTDGNVLKAELIGRPCSPIFQQKKILPPLAGLKLMMKKANDKFCLMHEAGHFEAQITGAAFMVQKVVLNESVREGIMRLMEEGHPLQYFLRTPSVNYYTIEAGSSQFMRDDLFMGRMPLHIIVAMIETRAYHGDNLKNPFNFQPFDISEFGLYLNGMPYPVPMQKLDFEKHICAEAYHNTLKSFEAAALQMNPLLSLDEFKNGFTIFSLNMSPDQGNTIHPAALRNMNSNIRLEMKFKDGVKENITVLVYSEMENLMEIGKDRIVTMSP